MTYEEEIAAHIAECRGYVRELGEVQGALIDYWSGVRQLVGVVSGKETFVAPLEVKFVGGIGETGVFSGLGACFNNIDSHGDIILPGAFAETLADYRAKGLMPGMYCEHSPYVGNDLLPVGVWTSLVEDSEGLRARGKISGAADTEFGRRIVGLMKDGALGGLSIAFNCPLGGAVMTGDKTSGAAKRILRRINLVSLDIVRDPSNPGARIDLIKSARALADHQAADAIGSGTSNAIIADLRRTLAAFKMPRL